MLGGFFPNCLSFHKDICKLALPISPTTINDPNLSSKHLKSKTPQPLAHGRSVLELGRNINDATLCPLVEVGGEIVMINRQPKLAEAPAR